ncbi:MAG: preprotein translocase subunit SecY [Bacilli bacterium]|nr:preprotein translocase subunit SecY [Bacilli bacterium]
MFKQIFNPANKDLRKKIWYTLACLFLFKIGTAIVVPGVDNENLNVGFLQLLDMMGGGAMQNFSIFALGVMPYITASIVMQLLQMDIIPYFTELAKQGQTGRNKINQITRILGIILAFVQGYMFSFAFMPNGEVMDYLEVSLVLTAGTAFLLWVGDRITTKGLGNGISMIIMAGILASTPYMFTEAWGALVDTTTTQSTFLGVITFILFVLVYVAVILGVLYVQLAERRIPVQYANKTNSAKNAKQTYMPFKINSAGVIPVIFASALISVPALIAQVAKNDAWMAFVNKWLSLSSVTGFILFIIFIILFSYFYTFITIKPKELSENLQKNGGYIPGVRPGEETEEYVTRVINRITIVGSLFLALIAGLPYIFGAISTLPTNVSLGGTGLIIVVGVVLECYKQLENGLISRSYKSRRSH